MESPELSSISKTIN